ncbi:MAG TPA: protease pro-enzyme activation domain-containing protein [Thermoplasmata archaeon]|nr:protease pro-enzyme activation domain-containing protein [Thermoplasmata archaeon]
MLPRRAPVVCAGAILLLLVLPFPAPLGPAHRGESNSLPGQITTDARPLPPGTPTTPLAGSTQITVTISLRPQNAASLSQYVQASAAPGFNRGSYLTEAQFEARYSPNSSQVALVQSYLASYAATHVTVTTDHLGVDAVMTANAVEASLGVQLEQVGSFAGRPLYTAVGTPSMPSALRAAIAGIGGLSDLANAGFSGELHRLSALAPTSGPGSFVLNNNSGPQLFIGSDFTQAFGVGALLPGTSTLANATFPTQEAVATILMSGFNNTTQSDTPGFDPIAVSAYFNDTFPAAWPHPTVVGVPVTVAGRTAPPPGGSGAIEDSSLDATENALDLEMAGSLAPGATVANFYFPASLYLSTAANPSVGDVADYFATALSAALSYNYTGASLVAVTNSFGLPDLNDSLWNTELLHAAALGVTVMAASGDQGNAPNDLSGRFQGQWPTWPGTAAFDGGATIAVGGLSIQLGGSPAGTYNDSGVNATFDPSVSGVASASAWYDNLGGAGSYSGSEGGVSTSVPEPAWQFDSAAQPTIANVSGAQGVSSLGRSEPDLAFAGNTTVAYTAHDAGGVYFETLQGTSIASPTFAGFLAACAAVAGHPFGVLDPELYRIASFYAAHPGPGDPFVDVSTGANYFFSAGPGWDPVTGWGFLLAPAFLSADANASVEGYVYVGPTPGLPPGGLPAHGPSASVPTLTLVILGVAIAVAVVIVILVARPKPPRGLPPPYYGPPAPPVPAYSPAPPPPGYPGPSPPAGPPSYAYSPGVPPTGHGGAPPVSPATFHCPYCGTMRPAEPVRCPGCGAF